MERIEIEDDEFIVMCPKCKNWEQHPIIKKRQLLRGFKVLFWSGTSRGNQLSVTKCGGCNHTFDLEWDYGDENISIIDRHYGR